MSYKLKTNAFSLLETVISMVLIMVCIGLSVNLFVQVNNSKKDKKLKLVYELKKLNSSVILNKTYYNDEFESEGYTIKRTIKKSPQSDYIFKIEHIAIDSKTDKEIASWEVIEIIE